MTNDNIAEILTQQAIKRGLWAEGDAPKVVQTPGSPPHERSFDLEKQLTTDEVLSRLGLSAPRGVEKETITKYSLDGQESRTRLDAVGYNLLLSELAMANTTPMKKMSTQAFLRPPVLEAALIRKMSPLLPWLEMANRQTVTTWEIQVPRMTYSFLRDPKLKIGQKIDEDAELPLVSLSELEKVPLSIGRYGLGTLFSEKAQMNSAVGLNEINLGLDAVKYSLAYTFNTIYAEEIGNHFSTTYRTSLPTDDQILRTAITTAWNDPSANPFEDIRNAALTSETTEDWFAASTHLYVNPNTFKDVMTYATYADHTWEINPLTGEKVFKVDDIQIVKLPPLNGMPDGNALLTSEPPGSPDLLDVYDLINGNLSKTGMLHVREDKNPRTGAKWFGFERYFACRLGIAKRVHWLDGVR
jgi:hypothetical protein